MFEPSVAIRADQQAGAPIFRRHPFGTGV